MHLKPPLRPCSLCFPAKIQKTHSEFDVQSLSRRNTIHDESMIRLCPKRAQVNYRKEQPWQTRNRPVRQRVAPDCATQPRCFWSATLSRQWSGTSNSGSNPNTIRPDLRYCAAMTLRYSFSNNPDTPRRRILDAGTAKRGMSTL